MTTALLRNPNTAPTHRVLAADGNENVQPNLPTSRACPCSRCLTPRSRGPSASCACRSPRPCGPRRPLISNVSPHMPIVDIEVVAVGAELAPQPSVAALASALGRIFASPPGHTWVRLRVLPASCYAENDAPTPVESLPVFVTVLQASPPQNTELQAQILAVTQAVAAWLALSQERVHVGYAPPAAGRQAFGGKLV